LAIFRGSGGSISGQTDALNLPVSISQGGTGQTDPNKAFNALAPSQASNSNKYLKTDGTNTAWDNIEISTADISGILSVLNGGTGASDIINARTNLGLAIGTDVPSPTGTGASGTWAIDVTGNAATVTNGIYTTGSYADPAWITSLAGSKVTGNITGNAANVTGTVAVANGGTGAATVSDARVNLLPSYTGNAGKVLGLNGSATDVEWISGAGSGSVTSVALSAPTGFAVTGSPITSTGTLALAFDTGYSLPTTTKQTEWDTAYTDRLKWDGGSTGLNASTARTNLGLVIGTDVPSPTGTGASGTWGISITGNAATATNGVVTTGSYADPSWITSLAGSKISGNISGNAANVTGTVVVANGGTGATTLTGYVKGNGTSAMTASATISGSDISGGTIDGGTY